MPNNPKLMAVLSQIKQSKSPLSLPEISALIAHEVPERTLRRWLASWVDSAIILRTGQKRGTRYQYNPANIIAGSNQPITETPTFSFLQKILKHRRAGLLEQIRDLWTHNSTALEGNTLTLGDTHALLGLGLTISGKPLKEHQEILGHAKAIDLIYGITQPHNGKVSKLTKSHIFDLHKAVQSEVVRDIFKPMGAWKLEPNGTYAITASSKQVFIEYAHPLHVDILMAEVISYINAVTPSSVSPANAAQYYARVHMAVVHIHPFLDGNGRIARLVANIILLKAGLPPLVIQTSSRREHIELLADYQIKMGQLNIESTAWPNDKELEPFIKFCEQAYLSTEELISSAIK